MVELARDHQGGPLSLKSISDSQQISLKYLEQLIAVLKGAGLVKAARGFGGGYRLARSPEQITLHDVFVAMEGPPNLVECVGDAESCSLHAICPTRATWVKMSSALTEILKSTTVRDLAEQPAQSELLS